MVLTVDSYLHILILLSFMKILGIFGSSNVTDKMAASIASRYNRDIVMVVK